MYAIGNIFCQTSAMARKPKAPTKKPTLGADQAARFGALIRQRRRDLKMSQDQLSLTTGVARQFIVLLEAGKPTSQLGLSLLVANAVGLRIFDLLAEDAANNALLPDMPEDDEDAIP
jgi:DNA-binding XRE family transcriptional regulator